MYLYLDSQNFVGWLVLKTDLSLSLNPRTMLHGIPFPWPLDSSEQLSRWGCCFTNHRPTILQCQSKGLTYHMIQRCQLQWLVQIGGTTWSLKQDISSYYMIWCFHASFFCLLGWTCLICVCKAYHTRWDTKNGWSFWETKSYHLLGSYLLEQLQ